MCRMKEEAEMVCSPEHCVIQGTGIFFHCGRRDQSNQGLEAEPDACITRGKYL